MAYFALINFYRFGQLLYYRLHLLPRMRQLTIVYKTEPLSGSVSFIAGCHSSSLACSRFHIASETVPLFHYGCQLSNGKERSHFLVDQWSLLYMGLLLSDNLGHGPHHRILVQQELAEPLLYLYPLLFAILTSMLSLVHMGGR